MYTINSNKFSQFLLNSLPVCWSFFIKWKYCSAMTTEESGTLGNRFLPYEKPSFERNYKHLLKLQSIDFTCSQYDFNFNRFKDSGVLFYCAVMRMVTFSLLHALDLRVANGGKGFVTRMDFLCSTSSKFWHNFLKKGFKLSLQNFTWDFCLFVEQNMVFKPVHVHVNTIYFMEYWMKCSIKVGKIAII